VKYAACIPRARLYVDVDGNLVYPCERFAFRKIGNLIRDDDIGTMWTKAEERYGRFPSTPCGSCGFTCYFETTVPLREPLQLMKIVANRRLSRV